MSLRTQNKTSVFPLQRLDAIVNDFSWWGWIKSMLSAPYPLALLGHIAEGVDRVKYVEGSYWRQAVMGTAPGK